MGILDDDVARVRESTDLVALAGEHIGLKRVGRRYMGLCPFHTEKTASFSVNQLGVYFASVAKRAAARSTFIREIEHLDFVEAVERLRRAPASRSGTTTSPSARTASAGAPQPGRRRRSVLPPPARRGARGGPGRKHLRSRNFDGDAARRFQLGWAPDGFGTLSVHLQREGFERRTSSTPGSRS
jgi:DNA primase